METQAIKDFCQKSDSKLDDTQSLMIPKLVLRQWRPQSDTAYIGSKHVETTTYLPDTISKYALHENPKMRHVHSV